jgi:hypothetical protein
LHSEATLVVRHIWTVGPRNVTWNRDVAEMAAGSLSSSRTANLRPLPTGNDDNEAVPLVMGTSWKLATGAPPGSKAEILAESTLVRSMLSRVAWFQLSVAGFSGPQ